MTTDEIFKLISFCRENSVTSFKLNDLEFYINHSDNIKVQASATFPKQSFDKMEDLMNPLNPLDDMTSEEILFAATPYYDELQEKKAIHQQKLNEEGK